MEADPPRNDLRKALRRREFGPNPVCVLCGADEPTVFHHFAGEANDCVIEGPHCLNCHALEHEGMRFLGVDLSRHKPRTVLEVVIAILQGLSVFFRLLSTRFEEWADRLSRLMAALDLHFPKWRDLEEAW